MTTTIPHVDVSRFKAISPRSVILAYLRSSKALTDKILARNLASVMPAEQLQTALKSLRDEGLMASTNKVELNDLGRRAADESLGRDAGKPWEIILSRRLPMVVLGIDPEGTASASIEALRARAIAVGFGLADQKSASTKKSVCSILVWQALKAGMPSVFGSASFPPIDSFGPIEKALLGKMADTRAKTIDQIFAALAAAAIQSKKADAENFRKGLIGVGLRSYFDKKIDSATARSIDSDTFADRVKHVSNGLTTPPFLGRVSISQVYDAYGRTHGDAGSLASFKNRLIEAAKSRSLALGRLELPEQMDVDQRMRSEATWGDDIVHFVMKSRNGNVD